MSQPWTFDTEAIYQALFDRVSVVSANGSGFVTASRVLQHWAEVPSANQPAVFQCQTGETYQPRKGMPPLVTLDAKLWIYAFGNADMGGQPSTVLNPLKDAIFAALAPSPLTNTQDLGGLVYHAWIEGSVLTDEGVLGSQAAMVMPVRIKVNN